ncbi:MAG: hypothetical protein ACXWVV_00130 [Kaistella sp.]
MSNLPQKSMDLIAHINNEIGIDIHKYGNDEILGTVTGMMNVQSYAVSSLAKALFLAFCIYILGFFVLQMEWMGYILYGIFGFILFSIGGILYGILNLTSKLNSDLQCITKFGLDTTRFIVSDFNQINTRLRDDISNPISLIFEGAIAAFLAPTISLNCHKIPIAGKVIASGSDKALGMVVTNLRKQEDKMNFHGKMADGSKDLSVKCEEIEEFLEDFSTKVEIILNKSIKAIQMPFRVAMFGTAALIGFFMLCIAIF